MTARGLTLCLALTATTALAADLQDQARRCFAILAEGRDDEALKLAETLVLRAERPGAASPLARRARLLRLATRAAVYARQSDPSLADKIRGDVAGIDSAIALSDVPFIKACLENAPAPAAPYLRRALRRARRRAGEAGGSLESFLAAMAIPDAEVRREATAALARRLALARRRVQRGGAMTEEDRRLCSSRLVISSLIDQLAREGGVASERLPAQALALDAGIGRASHALILIETPALAPLEAARRAGEPRARPVLEAIRIAVERRQRRFSKSTWSSAAGASRPR